MAFFDTMSNQGRIAWTGSLDHVFGMVASGSEPQNVGYEGDDAMNMAPVAITRTLGIRSFFGEMRGLETAITAPKERTRRTYVE
jgi:hypothetical protein